MQLPRSAHTSRPWRIHGIVPDFRLEDVWALPTPGGPGDFGRLLALMTATDPAASDNPASRLLWTAREKLGDLFGWDAPGSGLDGRVASLRDRLPADLRGDRGPEFRALPFSPVFRAGDEFAAELANRTVHAVMHLGWVPDGAGGHRGQLAVLVKPNGLLGAGYLAGIAPLRTLLVYPAMLRRIDSRWAATGA